MGYLGIASVRIGFSFRVLDFACYKEWREGKGVYRNLKWRFEWAENHNGSTERMGEPLWLVRYRSGRCLTGP